MPKNINLFAGPGQLVLYDSTNGSAFLGWADIKITEKAFTHENIQGDLIRYDRRYALTAEVPITDTPTLDDLEARDGIDQTIYIAGFEAYFTVSGVRMVYEVERNWLGAKIHSVEIRAQWKDPDDHQFAVNLLTLDSDIEIKFENFTTGVADGWNVANEDVAQSLSPSFRTGYCQSVAWVGAPSGQAFYSDYVDLFFSKPIKITASIYLKDADVGAGDIQFGFTVKLTDDSTVDYRGVFANNALSSSGARISYSAIVNEALPVKQILLSIYVDNNESLTLELDDAQLEFGNLSNFRED